MWRRILIMFKFRLLIVLFTLIKDLYGFNIQGIHESLSIRLANTTGQSSSKFFGYSFEIEARNSGYREDNHTFVIGTPKAQREVTEAKSEDTGNVFVCNINISTNKPSETCTPSPSVAVSSKGFGFNVRISPDRSITTCTPYPNELCDSQILKPGKCFQKGLGSGSAWRERQSLDVCPSPKVDLIFLLDASGSVGMENFELLKNWTKTIAQNFSIFDGSEQIGVVSYSHYFADRELDDQLFITTEIPLGSIRNHSQFNAAVDGIESTPYQTYTAHALNKTVMDFQSSHRFGLSSTRKILILVTDGRSTDRLHLPITTNYVRSQGITSFAVGIRGAQMDELRRIATGSYTNERIYFVQSYQDLGEIVERLKEDIRLFVNKGPVIDGADEGLFSAGSGFSVRFSRRVSTIVTCCLRFID